MTDASTWHGITDDTVAEGFVRKLVAAKIELARIRRNAQAEIDRIQAKAIADGKTVSDEIAWRENELTGYHRRIREKDPTRKKYPLAGADLVHRVGSKSTKVLDERAFVVWALVNAPAALKIEPRVSVLDPSHGFTRTKTGTIVAAGGEIVPGVSVVTGDDSYTVSLSTGGEA